MKIYVVRVVPLALLWTALVCVTSCGSSELTRGEAKRIIQKALDERPVGAITLSAKQLSAPPGPNKGTEEEQKQFKELTQEVFAWKDMKGCLPDPSDVRIATGQFILCPTPGNPDVTWQWAGFAVPLKKPIKRIVLEITGITKDGEDTRIVEHTWQYDFTVFPKFAQDNFQRESGSPRKDKAKLRLYDDGWRFAE